MPARPPHGRTRQREHKAHRATPRQHAETDNDRETDSEREIYRDSETASEAETGSEAGDREAGERGINSATHSQTGCETTGETGSQIRREANSATHSHTGCETTGETDGQIRRETGRETDGETDGQIGREAGGDAGSQEDQVPAGQPEEGRCQQRSSVLGRWAAASGGSVLARLRAWLVAGAPGC
jgi:hypothetical protein